MITYIVKKGENLTKIAYKHQTTVAIIVADNPIITDRNLIFPGWKLKIRTSEEYAREQNQKATQQKKVADVIKNNSATPSANLTTPVATITYQNQVISDGQIGIATLIRNASLYEFGTKGELKVIRALKKFERYKVYGQVSNHGGMYNVGKKMYVKKSDVRYEALPSAYIPSTQVGSVTVTNNSPSIKEKVSPYSQSVATIPQFQMPGYRRTRLKVKKPNGQTLHMEMRVVSLTSSYSNQYSASRTNAGFAIHTGGKNLPTLSFNGFLLDSRANREVDTFLEIYTKYLQPQSDDKYFSSKIVSILHKNREYKGVIVALNISENSTEPLDKKFAMQFMVLSEKSLTAEQMSSDWKLTVSRGSMTELEFRSDLKSMLSNPMTGIYNTTLASHN